MRRALPRWICAGGAFLAALLFCAPAGAGESLEYAVKGTYLYKFIPFVDWPASSYANPASPVTICIYGSDPFGADLARAVRGEKNDGHPVALQNIQTPDTLAACQILYIGNDSPVGDVLHAVEGRPVLTVTETSGGAHGVINFVLQGPHVRFDIDEAMAARSRLTISSKLLGLAHAVIPRSGP
ncbi:MAG TPA: YfiR family protein [Rhizomicrobium sp.]